MENGGGIDYLNYSKINTKRYYYYKLSIFYHKYGRSRLLNTMETITETYTTELAKITPIL